ncbi:MAG TPA: ABC transporter ATP-binding protein [Actinomycetota bacterium]|nr:ABC transporter ATP-binding protein [Actinomycetota bacterium]
MRTDETAASCAGVVKIYWTETSDVHALKGVDARFPRAAVTAVVGPSGAGKSSLLRILAGLDAPTAGTVSIEGAEITGLSPSGLRKVRGERVGYVFQRPSDNLISYLNALEHVRLAARLRGVSARDEAEGVLEMLGLGERWDHLPHELSGGEQQRLAFAQAVVGNPAVVIADEPTAQLDSRSAEALLSYVVDLAHGGIAFVISTHDLQVVETADTTLHLRHGSVEAESRGHAALAVIDAFGRVQLPPEALEWFPDRRAVIEMEDGSLRITPP